MRHHELLLFLLLNICLDLANGRLPYIRSSGYYSPYPPKNPVLYEFSPLEETAATAATSSSIPSRRPDSGEPKNSRGTRDLAWSEFDAFLRGDEEPSCADLRRMWRLARKLQEQAIESNEIPRGQPINPFSPGGGTSYTNNPKHKGTKSKSNRGKHHNNKTPEVIPATDSSQQQSTKELRRQKFSASSSQKGADRDAEDGAVYGVVRTHAPAAPPPNAIRVRDPAKDLFGMMHGGSGAAGGHRFSAPIFGRHSYHQKPGQRPNSGSSFDQLRSELYGKERGANGDKLGQHSYGVLRHSPPAPHPTPKPAVGPSFDVVRNILLKEQQSETNKNNDNDQTSASLTGSSSSKASSASSNAFDRIRAKLMSTRLREKLQNAHRRGLRRKGSRKRRRNAEEIAALQQRLLKDYLTSALKSGEKHRKNRKNQKKKNRKNRKKWHVSRDKIRKQNILLKKLG